ncbi:7256_t:CDS:1, partial [Dentiscutata heterogama]
MCDNGSVGNCYQKEMRVEMKEHKVFLDCQRFADEGYEKRIRVEKDTCGKMPM